MATATVTIWPLFVAAVVVVHLVIRLAWRIGGLSDFIRAWVAINHKPEFRSGRKEERLRSTATNRMR